MQQKKNQSTVSDELHPRKLTWIPKIAIFLVSMLVFRGVKFEAGQRCRVEKGIEKILHQLDVQNKQIVKMMGIKMQEYIYI